MVTVLPYKLHYEYTASAKNLLVYFDVVSMIYDTKQDSGIFLMTF